MWQVCLSTLLPRPLARAWNRLRKVPRSTWIVLTFSTSMSAPSLCSALAIADSSTFFRIAAPFLGVSARILSARSTGLPRIRSATSRPFWADMCAPRSTARVSISGSLLLAAGRRRGRRRRSGWRSAGLPIRGMAFELPRQRKLAELVSDHVFGDVHRDVLLPVVHRNGQSDEIRHDRRATRPGLYRSLVARAAHGIDFLDEMQVHK